MNNIELMNIFENLRKHAVQNGTMLASVVSIEECSELQKELTKFLRTDSEGDKTNLIEEMADV